MMLQNRYGTLPTTAVKHLKRDRRLDLSRREAPSPYCVPRKELISPTRNARSSFRISASET